MFSSNPDLGIMEQAYMKLKTTSALRPSSLPFPGLTWLTGVYFVQIPICSLRRNRRNNRLPIWIDNEKKRSFKWP